MRMARRPVHQPGPKATKVIRGLIFAGIVFFGGVFIWGFMAALTVAHP